MTEELKPIEEEQNPELKEISLPKPISKPTQVENKQIINSLPSWSIEPPVEIKRGN